MTEIRTILYATDFSDSSKPAADYALYLTRLTGARLHVLHVIAELADRRRSMVQPESFDILEKEVEKRSVRELTEFCRQRFGEQVPYEIEVVIGYPPVAIVQKAGEIPADLIILGTHGYSAIEHVLIGSTAERVVRRSPIPVLTIRGE